MDYFTPLRNSTYLSTSKRKLNSITNQETPSRAYHRVKTSEGKPRKVQNSFNIQTADSIFESESANPNKAMSNFSNCSQILSKKTSKISQIENLNLKGKFHYINYNILNMLTKGNQFEVKPLLSANEFKKINQRIDSAENKIEPISELLIKEPNEIKLNKCAYFFVKCRERSIPLKMKFENLLVHKFSLYFSTTSKRPNANKCMEFISKVDNNTTIQAYLNGKSNKRFKNENIYVTMICPRQTKFTCFVWFGKENLRKLLKQEDQNPKQKNYSETLIVSREKQKAGEDSDFIKAYMGKDYYNSTQKKSQRCNSTHPLSGKAIYYSFIQSRRLNNSLSDARHFFAQTRREESYQMNLIKRTIGLNKWTLVKYKEKLVHKFLEISSVCKLGKKTWLILSKLVISLKIIYLQQRRLKDKMITEMKISAYYKIIFNKIHNYLKKKGPNIMNRQHKIEKLSFTLLYQDSSESIINKSKFIFILFVQNASTLRRIKEMFVHFYEMTSRIQQFNKIIIENFDNRFNLLKELWKARVIKIFNSSKSSKGKRQVSISKKIMSLSDEKRDEAIRNYIKEARANFKIKFLNWYRQISEKEKEQKKEEKQDTQEKHELKLKQETPSNKLNPQKVEELNSLYLKAPKPKIIPSDKDFQTLIFKSAGIPILKTTKKK